MSAARLLIGPNSGVHKQETERQPVRTVKTIVLASLFLMSIIPSCVDTGGDPPVVPTLTPDEALFQQITQVDPFTSYTLFPNADSVTSGTLNGSTAHQPLVRVSLNTRALSVLVNGSLPTGSSFPIGSIVFKQIILNDLPTLYAVMYKDSTNPLSANGWLWAEYQVDGTVAFSVGNKGSGCVGCHSLEEGVEHDLVRTFERQR
jgi:hypothetical protein